MLALEVGEDLLGPPGRMSHAGLQDGGDDVRGCDLVGAARSARPLGEPSGTLLLVAMDPLVAGLAADAVWSTEGGDGVETGTNVGEKAVAAGTVRQSRYGEPALQRAPTFDQYCRAAEPLAVR